MLKLLLLALVFMSVYGFFVDKLSKGYVDPYYHKFTQEAGSLIIGLSRADGGMSPVILENALSDLNISKPIVNFGMNDGQFGEVYLQGIQKKITNSNNGIYIISISPGNFRAPAGLDAEQILEFDKRLQIGKITNFTSAPNYNYILNTYGLPLYSAFFPLDKWPHRITHDNGWNEVVLNTEKDTIRDSDIAHWKSLNIRFYNEKAKILQLAPYRYEWFLKTLAYLKTKGPVFMVRTPSDLDVLKLENSYWQDFDKEMDSIANVYNIPYFNYSETSNNYKTYDGSHLESESAKRFSQILSEDIKAYLQQHRP